MNLLRNSKGEMCIKISQNTKASKFIKEWLKDFEQVGDLSNAPPHAREMSIAFKKSGAIEDYKFAAFHSYVWSRLEMPRIVLSVLPCDVMAEIRREYDFVNDCLIAQTTDEEKAVLAIEGVLQDGISEEIHEVTERLRLKHCDNIVLAAYQLINFCNEVGYGHLFGDILITRKRWETEA